MNEIERMVGVRKAGVCEKCGEEMRFDNLASMCNTCFLVGPEFKDKIDLVNEPPHYMAGPVECIDLIESLELGYHLGNVLKYLYRHKRKGGLEDLKKARWYLDREIDRQELRG